jgi:flagellar hook-associated protein 3 FlgL
MDLTLFTNFAGSVGQQESQINTLQAQISDGLAVSAPDQNPGAFQTAVLANDQIGQLAAENITQGAIQSQLGSAGGVYSSVLALFDNVQSVIEQALNGSTNAQDIQATASQISSSVQQLVSLGNTTGSNGTYLFGGSRGNVAPFQAAANGSIVYLGDGAQSLAAIAPGDNVPVLSNGDVFVGGLAGDGVASVTAAASNTGSAGLVNQGVVNPAAAAAFQTGSTPIQLSFSQGPSGLIYTATAGGATVATGPVGDTTGTGGQILQLAGEDFQLSGQPEAGDSFTLSPSRPQSAFTLLQNLATALSAVGSTPSQAAQTRQVLNQSLAGLAQYQQAVVSAQAQNGVTLQAVTAAGTRNANQSTALQSTVQATIGLDTPAAIAQLDLSVTALQAAMKAFGSVQNLSLFSYI